MCFFPDPEHNMCIAYGIYNFLLIADSTRNLSIYITRSQSCACLGMSSKNPFFVVDLLHTQAKPSNSGSSIPLGTIAITSFTFFIFIFFYKSKH